MALTEPRVAIPAAVDEAPRHGFRPASRRRVRIAGGAALIAAGIGGNVLVYSSLDDHESVLQVVRDVPAGAQLTAADLRPIDVDADDTLRAVGGDQLPAVVGQYAKVRLVSGSLVVAESLQGTPLVSAGAAVVAVRVPDGALPAGLRERSQVQLVVPSVAEAGAGSAPSAPSEPSVVFGRVVGLPSAPSTATGTLSLSVEVPEHLAATVVSSDDVRIVLLQPGTDAAYVVDDGSDRVATGTDGS